MSKLTQLLSSKQYTHDYPLQHFSSQERFVGTIDVNPEFGDHGGGVGGSTAWELICKFAPFLSLVPTTLLSLLLLIADAKQWVAPPEVYILITSNRASIQLVVQILASVLGFLDMFVICKIIHYRTRLRLSVSSMSLNTLHFWNAMLSRQFSTRLPLHRMFILAFFLILAAVPSALWAGAMTPVATVVQQTAFLQVPSYSNTTLLTLNWSDRTGLPSVTESRGLFTYNVGERFLGQLLQEASSATTVDGSPRVNAKLDYTGYNFIGRSYGVGTSVGLADASISANPLAAFYTYQERGYQATVNCIYNSSSKYGLTTQDTLDNDVFVFIAQGYLPNSNNNGEWARYLGYSMDGIVAIGVATRPGGPRRILGITAGKNYANLNNTQCETVFEPALFNVSVSLAGRNITVVPVANVSVPDIEPSGNLTFLANWQFTLMATDQTSLYTSLVGDSFNSSIQNYQLAKTAATGRAASAEEATLGGLANSITASMDGILNGYAGAQVQVANVTEMAAASVGVNAIRFGQKSYLIAVFVINLIIALWAIFEAIQTRGWAALEDFDYMDPTDLVLGLARSYEASDGKIVNDGAEKSRISQRGRHLILSDHGWS